MHSIICSADTVRRCHACPHSSHVTTTITVPTPVPLWPLSCGVLKREVPDASRRHPRGHRRGCRGDTGPERTERPPIDTTSIGPRQVNRGQGPPDCHSSRCAASRAPRHRMLSDPSPGQCDKSDEHRCILDRAKHRAPDQVVGTLTPRRGKQLRYTLDPEVARCPNLDVPDLVLGRRQAVPPSDEPQGHSRRCFQERFSNRVDQISGPRGRPCLLHPMSDPQEFSGIIRSADQETPLLVSHHA